MRGKIAKAIVCLTLFGVMLTSLQCSLVNFGALGQNPLKRFSSFEELEAFVKASTPAYPSYSRSEGTIFFLAGTLSAAEDYATVSSGNYSTTNIQVEGVDEADIIKTDGEYIYLVSGKKVIIVKAYPPEEAQLLSEIELEGGVREIFINGDKLVVFEQRILYSYRSCEVSIKVYDVSNRESPLLKREVSMDGYYFSSRMVGDYTYVVINTPAFNGEGEVLLPKLCFGDRVIEIPATDIYYADVSDCFYTCTTIVAINTQNDDQEPAYETLLLGEASNMYVSLNNIYITFPVQGENYSENTAIHRIHIEDGEIKCEASGEVPGRLLNQFSMDEYNGCFRVATTTGNLARSFEQATSRNHLYILDMDLNIVGWLEDLAPGERIYSARFMGNRCYLVTFRKVDPLFVIDLSNPYIPKVLGELHITGYSDYLHPYDENHVIGIGKETVAAQDGDFAWYQGVKISLFDVSDVSNPKEIDKYIIGDRGTDSPVLRDHKALLFDKSKNLLVIPVLVAEVDEEKYPDGVPPNAHGHYVWQGVYIFNISLEEGLTLKGGITHYEGDADLSGYYFFSPHYVKRSLYIGDVLYTISDVKIKMNSLENLDYINEVELP